MSSLFRSPEETALIALGVAIEAAATFYAHAQEISDEKLQPMLKARAEALSKSASAWNDAMKSRDFLPGTPDEDAESLRHLALLAGTRLGADEESVVCDMCARTEQRLLAAIGEAAPVALGAPFIEAAAEAGRDCLAAIAAIWRLRTE